MNDEKEEKEAVYIFSDEPATQEIKLKSKSGEVKTFTLRELMGDALSKWQAYDASRISVSRNRIDMAPDAFKDYSATLISMCLFDDLGNPVKISTIRNWPSSAINGIFEICQTMNGLNVEGRDKAKKA